MGYKTKEELVNGLTAYANYFKRTIPKSFPVHADYLVGGLTVSDFCKCYEIYREKMRSLQLAMAENPEDFGMIEKNKKGELCPVYSMANPYVWLFLALAKSGETKNDRLLVNGDKFKNFCNGAKVGQNTAKPKTVDRLLLKLLDFGFAIDGDINGGFHLSSDVHGLCATIKASTLTKYAGMSMASDYPAFNYRMYQFGIDETLPFEETISYSLMTDGAKEFSLALINGMKKQGWSKYIIYFHSIDSGRLTFPTVEYYIKLNIKQSKSVIY